MTEARIKENLASNIAAYRKRAGLTQAELAEQIHYSDKSVSKWERGEGVPDAVVLKQLADVFHVTADDLLSEDPPKAGSKHVHLLVLLLSAGLVAFVASVIFFVVMLIAPQVTGMWRVFVYMVPVAAIVATVFTVLWWEEWKQAAAVSVLVWGVAVSIHVTAPSFPNIALIYLVAGGFQVLAVLWFILRRKLRRRGESVSKSGADQDGSGKSGSDAH